MKTFFFFMGCALSLSAVTCDGTGETALPAADSL